MANRKVSDSIQQRRRINVTFTQEDFDAIATLAAKKSRPGHQVSMSDIVRDFALAGLKGQITTDNADVLAPIIRSQLEAVLIPQIERLAKLTSKTCVQAGTAAYLCAGTLSAMLPEDQRVEFDEAYAAARKKSVEYTRMRTTE